MFFNYNLKKYEKQEGKCALTGLPIDFGNWKIDGRIHEYDQF